VESDSFDIPDGQTLMSRLQWEDSPDISPTDSASSKASEEATRMVQPVVLIKPTQLMETLPLPFAGTNHSDSRRPKKKKTSLGLNSGGGGGVGVVGVGVVGVGVVGVGGGGIGGGGMSGGSSSSQSNISLSTKRKRPKLSAPSITSIYDDLN